VICPFRVATPGAQHGSSLIVLPRSPGVLADPAIERTKKVQIDGIP
jgi:hypothetical protein